MSEQASHLKKHFKEFLYSLTVLLVISLVSYFIIGTSLKSWSYDFLTSNVGGKFEKPHKDVMLLLIDENALKVGEKKYNLGRWPWGRNVYANILEYIHSAGTPKGIFFDIIYSENDRTPGNDASFQEAIAGSGKVFHNMLFINDNEKPERSKLSKDMNDFFSIKVAGAENLTYKKIKSNEFLIPIPCLRLDLPCSVHNIEGKDYEPIAKGLSVASFKPDDDGVHRRGHLMFNYDGKYFPSVSMAAVMAYQEDEDSDEKVAVTVKKGNLVQIGKYTAPVDDQGNYLINYYQKEHRILNESYSMSAVFESANKIANGITEGITLPPEEFNNKIIIIGCSAVGCEDLKTSPIDARMPGPEIHATMISNILQGNHLKQMPAWLNLILIMLFITISIACVFLVGNLIVELGVPALLMAAIFFVGVFLFQSNIFIPVFQYIAFGFLANSLAFGYKSVSEGKEKRKYSKVLGNMVDPQIVKEALHDLESLKKGGEKVITPFFSDVASFSTISEKLSSTDLAALLNEYLSAMTLILKKHGGTLDKYIGDAIVGIFGAPIDLEDAPIKAAEASIDMRHRMLELRKEWIEKGAYCKEAQEMAFRIGLNTGKAKVGFMGTDDLASYTMMGDTVNLAARLEAAAKDYGVDLLVSKNTADLINKTMKVRWLDQVRVKGKDEPVQIYELVDRLKDLPANIDEACSLYEAGFNLYLKRDWLGAIEKFKESMTKKGENDKAAQLLIARCKWYSETPPKDSWDGVFTRTHK